MNGNSAHPVASTDAPPAPQLSVPSHSQPSAVILLPADSSEDTASIQAVSPANALHRQFSGAADDKRGRPASPLARKTSQIVPTPPGLARGTPAAVSAHPLDDPAADLQAQASAEPGEGSRDEDLSELDVYDTDNSGALASRHVWQDTPRSVAQSEADCAVATEAAQPACAGAAVVNTHSDQAQSASASRVQGWRKPVSGRSVEAHPVHSFAQRSAERSELVDGVSAMQPSVDEQPQQQMRNVGSSPSVASLDAPHGAKSRHASTIFSTKDTLPSGLLAPPSAMPVDTSGTLGRKPADLRREVLDADSQGSSVPRAIAAAHRRQQRQQQQSREHAEPASPGSPGDMVRDGDEGKHVHEQERGLDFAAAAAAAVVAGPGAAPALAPEESVMSEAITDLRTGWRQPVDPKRRKAQQRCRRLLWQQKFG